MSWTANQIRQVYDSTEGKCIYCGVLIGTGSVYGRDWHVGHGKKSGGYGKACGGTDHISDCGPAHTHCNLEHAYRVEIPLAAKLKRIRNRHIGIKKPSRFAWLRELKAKILAEREKSSE
jgi:hypothetical protein